MSDSLIAALDGRVLRLRLNRAESRNVLTAEMCAAAASALRRAAADEDMGAILLEASGPVFCAGCEDDAAFAELLGAVDGLTKPLVVCVQGPAMNEGVFLIAAAHVAVAAQGSTFAVAHIRQGAFSANGFDTLARAIGKRRALELCITGRVFTQPDALQWGLVHHAAPAFEVDDRASAIAESLATMNPRAMAEALDYMKSG